MNRIILLDTGVLAMVTHPKISAEVEECTLWMKGLAQRGDDIALPEIADYELRRELLRAKKTQGLAKLDAFKADSLYIPITTETMLKAAEFWATARNQGRTTADAKALDGDVILAAQAHILSKIGYEVIIATTNVKHLSLFADARKWREINK